MLKNFCISVTRPTQGEPVHTGCYLLFLGSYNICIIYLHVTEGCLKVTNAMFYFFCLKNPSNIMKKIFNPIFIYF